MTASWPGRMWVRPVSRKFASIQMRSARHHREHGGAGIDEVADLQVIDPRHDAVVGRHHRRVGQIEPGLVELGLGCADRRMAIDLDIWIAVQRGHGVGDLLCRSMQCADGRP